MTRRHHFGKFFVLGIGLLCNRNAFAGVTDLDCGGLNQRACTLFDSEFWANNSGFCDFGLKSTKGVLAALSGGSAGKCVNDTRQTVPKDNSWTGWALSQQRYGIQKYLPLNFITHLGTHNSFSNYSDKDNNWLSTNQQYSITDQLNLGARVIRIDPHYYFSEMRTCHSESNATEAGGGTKTLESCTAQAIQNYLPVALALAPNLTLIHLLPQPVPTIVDLYIANILIQAAAKKTIAINNRLYASSIREVGDWLTDNPGEFVVVMGDDYAEGQDDLVNSPIKNFLGSKVWTPSDQDSYAADGIKGWPTMAELQSKNKQVIMFSKGDDHKGTWLFSEKTWVTEGIYPKVAGSGNKTDADLTANPNFWGCSYNSNTFSFYRYSSNQADRMKWFQTGEGRTGSDYLFGPFTGEVNAPEVQQAVACGFSTIRLDFFMALDRAYSKYRHSEPDLRREAAIWSYAEGDFGQAGPAVMNGATGRWTSVNLGATMRFACATKDKSTIRQWAVSPTANNYFAGDDPKLDTPAHPAVDLPSDPCLGVSPNYEFAAPVSAAENRDLLSVVKAANVPQVMLRYSAITIPPVYISPSSLKLYMDRGDVAPDQVVDQIVGSHSLSVTPLLTSDESGALSILAPPAKTPLEGGFIPLTMEYNQELAQSLATQNYTAMAVAHVYFSDGSEFSYSPLTSAAIALQVLEPTHTAMTISQPVVLPGGTATFTVNVAPLCGVKPTRPKSEDGGIIDITGVVSFKDVYQPSYGGPPVTQILGNIPINNHASDPRDNDDGVMHAILQPCPPDSVCAYTNGLGEGRHNITAVYHMDSTYADSSSTTQVVDVLDNKLQNGSVSLILGAHPSQTYVFGGSVGDTWQILPGQNVIATPSSGRFSTNSVTTTLSIVDAPGLLPGVTTTAVNVHRTNSAGVLVTDAYQSVIVTVPTRLSVVQTPLSFTAVDETPSPEQEVAVGYDGGSLTVTADVSTPQQWLSGALTDPGVPVRGSQTVKVQVDVNPAGLAPGHYTGALRIGAPSGPGVFSVPVSLDVTLTVPHYTINTVPAGLRAVIDGVDQATPVTFEWAQGSRHTLAAPASFQAVSDGVRAIFASWDDHGAVAHTVFANGSHDYTATYKQQYQFSSQKSPVCGGMVLPAGKWYDAGTPATISATAGSQYRFSSFSGDVASTNSTLAFLMDGPKSLTANFACTGTLCQSPVVVPYATGDLNRDGRVDCTDVTIVKAALGSKKGQAGFDPRADVNGDGVIDVRDLAIVTQQLPTGVKCQ